MSCSRFLRMCFLLSVAFATACVAEAGEGKDVPASQPASAPAFSTSNDGEHVFVGYSFALLSEPRLDSEPAGVELQRGQAVDPTDSAVDPTGLEWLGWLKDGNSVWVPEALISHVYPANLREGDLPIGEETVDRWRALPLDYRPSDLAPVPRKITVYPDRDCLMRPGATKKAVEMFAAAREQGHELRIYSIYRPASVQRDLYLNRIKTNGYGQQTVARPGTSEHQLGTAMDINGPDEKTLLVESFGETPEGRWVKANCTRYGFVISYTRENQPLTGYAPEPWHLRYVGERKARDWRPQGPPAHLQDGNKQME